MAPRFKEHNINYDLLHRTAPEDEIDETTQTFELEIINTSGGRFISVGTRNLF